MVATLPGASVWEQEVYDQFLAHIEAESEILDAYRKLASDLGSSDVTYLANLILEDEVRHHRLFQELANALSAEVQLGPSVGGIPEIPAVRADPSALLEATNRLLELEETDARELKRLQRSVRPVADTTLWSLVIETMELDTRKHIAILRRIRKIAKGLPL